jgi:hypothetical protein
MAPRDKDEMNDQDDDLPILADDDTDQPEAQDTANAATDADDDQEYDALADMADDEQHILGLMSDEELAALRGEDDDEGDEGDDPAPAQAGDDGTAIDSAAEDAPVASQPAQVELTTEQLADIDRRVKEARTEARKAWQDGDLTDEEFDAAIDQAEALRQTAAQELMQESAEDAAEREFLQRKEAFVPVAKEYLTKDFPALASAEHLEGFDRHVRAVTSNPLHAGKTPRQQLDLARKLYVAEVEDVLDVTALRGAGKAPAAKPAATPAPKPTVATTQAAKPPKREVVPTLARVPAAAANLTSDGKYGALQAEFDAADAAGREKLMARMSPEEREAFASLDV